jgi:hypothetical protein
MPFQLRRMFAYLFLFYNPTNCLVIWEKYKNFFCEDFNHHSLQDSENRCLNDIESIFKSHGMSLKDFNLPKATPISDLVYLEFNVEVESNLAENNKLKLNDDQKTAVEEILNAVYNHNHDNEAKCFLLMDQEGREKRLHTTLLCTF